MCGALWNAEACCRFHLHSLLCKKRTFNLACFWGMVRKTAIPMHMKRFFIYSFCSIALALVSQAENKISESQQKWVKVYQKQANIPKISEMLVNTDPAPDLSEGFVSLTNGKDLEGWTPRGGTCKFEVKDGVIVGTCVKGSPSTYLSTNKSDYGDFVFTAELKHAVDGNTGFMFRAAAKPGKKGKETVFGPQCEVEAYSKQRFWSGGIYGQSCGGWFYPTWLEAHAKTRESIKKQGQWNRITIQAKGDTVKTWLNGNPAAHWKNSEYLKGFFSLQIHSGKAGEIHFRNIKVKEL